MTTLFECLRPIFDEFEPCSDSDVDRLTAIIGLPLPVEYVAFLKRYGRCMINGDATIQDNGIFTFFGTSGEAGNVIVDYLCHDDFVEQKLVPVADDLFNNRYVLDATTGAIGFIEYGAGKARYLPVARSFEDFVGSILVVPFADGA